MLFKYLHANVTVTTAQILETSNYKKTNVHACNLKHTDHPNMPRYCQDKHLMSDCLIL